MVLFPDLLPAENVTARSSLKHETAEPDAVWGAADAIRAVMVPQDSSEHLRTFATLDLAVAAAGVAAAAAEEAANFGELDRYPPIQPSASSLGSVGNGDENGDGGRASKSRSGWGGAGIGVGIGIGGSGTDRPSLIVEVVATLLKCDRERVTGAGMISHGLDIFYKQEVTSSPPSVPVAATAAGLGAHWKAGDTGEAGPGMNERASELAGKRVVGDAVVVLMDGGLEHGAAGSGVVDGGDGEKYEALIRRGGRGVRNGRRSDSHGR